MDILCLPDELLLMTLKYVSSNDLLCVARTCRRFAEITCDRRLVSTLNFHFEERLHVNLLRPFVASQLRNEHVVTIDLTSCYWLTSSFIYNVVLRLRNVVNVLVVDTALSAKHLKQLLQALPTIRRLSWTWDSTMSSNGIVESLQSLIFLYLCIPCTSQALDASLFIKDCEGLEELWVVSPMPLSQPRSHITAFLDGVHMEKVTVFPIDVLRVSLGMNIKHSWQQDPLHIPDQLPSNQIESFRAWNWKEALCVSKKSSDSMRRFCVPNQSSPEVEEVLRHLPQLTALHVTVPDNSTNDLLLNQSSLQELSLTPATKHQQCSTVFCEMVYECSFLKRLCLPTQAIVCEPMKPCEPNSSSSGKKRVSHMTNQSTEGIETPFRKMVRSTPLIEEFEIGTCSGYFAGVLGNLQWDFFGLTAVVEWKHLSSLSLTNLPAHHGKFLLPILQGCTELKQLKLMDIGPRGRCVYYNDLCQALPFSANLWDFKWDQANIGNTHQLWKALSCIKPLHRVSVSSDGESDIDENEIYSLMEKCPSLIFLHATTSATKVKCKRIKKNLMARWSKQRPPLVVWLGQLTERKSQLQKLPGVHVGEMVTSTTRIAGVPSSSSKFYSFRYLEPIPWAPHV